MSIMDNSAIERIATPDLTSDALALLDIYGANDDVVFFLGRLVWQGEMVDCAPALAKIASDQSRGRYARIASIRGVMAVGDAEQKDGVWATIADAPGCRAMSNSSVTLPSGKRTVSRFRPMMRPL